MSAPCSLHFAGHTARHHPATGPRYRHGSAVQDAVSERTWRSHGTSCSLNLDETSAPYTRTHTKKRSSCTPCPFFPHSSFFLSSISLHFSRVDSTISVQSSASSLANRNRHGGGCGAGLGVRAGQPNREEERGSGEWGRCGSGVCTHTKTSLRPSSPSPPSSVARFTACRVVESEAGRRGTYQTHTQQQHFRRTRDTHTQTQKVFVKRQQESEGGRGECGGVQRG